MQSTGGQVHLGYLLLLGSLALCSDCERHPPAGPAARLSHPHHLLLASLQSSPVLRIISRFYSCAYQEETNHLLDCSSRDMQFYGWKQESKTTTGWFINKAEKKISFRTRARTQAGALREHLFCHPTPGT